MYRRINTGVWTLLLIGLMLPGIGGLHAQVSVGDPLGASPFTVVLDAGHGGHDPGNLGNGYLEKNIALNIVLQAGKVLETSGVRVVYTRKDDSFVNLFKRGEIANKAKADLFVSVHCDAHSSDAYGAGTYVLGLHANKQNFEVAKKENSVIYLEDNYETRYADYDINSPESVIGLTIMQEEFLEQSILVGKLMQDRFTKNLSRRDRKVKQAGFIVLHQTFMPSVLVETGFLTNKNEGKYLNSEKGQREIGRAIAEAVLEYRNTVRPEPATAGAGTPEITQAPDPGETTPADNQVTERESSTLPPADPRDNEPKNSTPPPAETAREKAAETVADPPTDSALKIDKLPEADAEIAGAATQKAGGKPDAQAGAAGGQLESRSEETVTQPIEEKTGQIPPTTEKPLEDKAPAEAESAAGEDAGIIFKVQLMAISKEIPLTPANFRGLGTLSREPVNNMYRILYGNTPSYEQAKILQAGARQKGYDKAYIVAYKDGERIPVERALQYLAN